jgi:hypothetical protein
MLLKIAAKCWVFDYTRTYSSKSSSIYQGRWTEITGLLADMNAYFVRNNGELLCGGAGGRVFVFDREGVYDDNFQPITTSWQSSWLSMEEPLRSTKRKQGKYIKPTFQVGSGNVTYTVSVSAAYDDQSSSDRITYTATTAAAVSNPKLPLRWRGQNARITIESSNTKGPDIIGTFTVYANKEGYE